jgi:hypothetical protein
VNKFIVCTSINAPTIAIEKYDAMGDWTLIVVGDLKTPPGYALKNGIYLNPKDQEKMGSSLSELIGWNCIQRRNFGLLHALNLGADAIAIVDDDNIPLDNWGQEILIGQTVQSTEFFTAEEAFDPIGATNYPHLWHRGFPLELINSRNYDKKMVKEIVPDIQADFWNGDPDIDAICRLEHRPNCEFNDSTFPFSSNKISPFNSQNTVISRNVAIEYFLYPHIGRMDDIWASYYVQSKGFKVIYNKPTVFQDRNEHNLIIDMKKEYIGYENNLQLLKDLNSNPDNIRRYIPEKSYAAWGEYRKLIN